MHAPLTVILDFIALKFMALQIMVPIGVNRYSSSVSVLLAELPCNELIREEKSYRYKRVSGLDTKYLSTIE